MEKRKQLEEMLTNPFDGLTEEKIQEQCDEIAEELFCHHCINCNGKKYYFAEIEFYYWDNTHWNKNWNRMTYPRKSKAMKLFFHLSGTDICFESDYDPNNLDDEAKFGGILIRTIRSEDGITAGPWNCMLKIMNDCQDKQMPQIEYLGKNCNSKDNIAKTYRCLGKDDMESEREIATRKENPLNLHYYDSKVFADNVIKQEKIKLGKRDGALRKSPSVYKLFKLNK